MSRERKRKAKEPIEKGIPIADPGAEIIFNDPILKSPFISNPFMSRLKGRAFLEQMIAYNLYFDDLTQKWKPLSDISISTVKNLARYYPTDPDPPTMLSDLPLRLNEYHELEVIDILNKNTLNEVKVKLDTLIAKNTEIELNQDTIIANQNILKSFNSGVTDNGTHNNIATLSVVFNDIGIPWTAVDILLDVQVISWTVSIEVAIYLTTYKEIFSEVFSTVDVFKRRIVFPTAVKVKVKLTGSVTQSNVVYCFTGSHLPFETTITS